MGKGGLNIVCKLCIMWDIKSQGFEDGKDPWLLLPVQSMKEEFGCFLMHIPPATSQTNTPGLPFSRSCSRLTKFLESLKTPEETTSSSCIWERPGSHRTMLAQLRPPGRTAWPWAAKP